MRLVEQKHNMNLQQHNVPVIREIIPFVAIPLHGGNEGLQDGDEIPLVSRFGD